MTAKIGYQPSFLWRSLTAARQTVMEGTAWRIGNGSKVQVFGDRWIGMKNVEKSTCIPHMLDPKMMVSELIDSESKTWRSDFIRQHFPTHEANRICAMHISDRLPADKMLWRHSKNGSFSVKSAYYALINQAENTCTDFPSSSGPNEAWKKVWQLKILPKIKHFTWKACLNALPTKDKLIEKNMVVDPVCGLCGEGTETLTHLMLECRLTLPIWLYSPFRINPSVISFGSFKNFLWCMMNSLPTEAIEFICITAWCIWTARNKYYFEHTPIVADKVRTRAQNFFLEINGKKDNKEDHEHRQQILTKWTPPPHDYLKLNSDAAIYNDAVVGYGFIVRNHRGEVILAGATKKLMEGSTTLVEGLAILFALKAAKDAGIRNLQIESDCKILIDGLQGKPISDTHGDLIRDDILVLARELNCQDFRFIPREANRAAHFLAHLCTETIWNMEGPPMLEGILNLDVISND